MLVGISGPIFLAKELRSPTDIGEDIWTNICSQSVMVHHQCQWGYLEQYF